MRKGPAVALVVLVVVGAGCRTTFVRGGTTPAPTPTPSMTRVGSGLLDEEEPSSTPRAEEGSPSPTAFVLTLVDQNDGRPAGIPVEVTGPVRDRFLSDEEGRVRVVGPPGRYRAEVATGCTDELQVLEGGGGRFGIAEGTTGRAELPVRWRHRYAPASPVHSSFGPTWPTGEEVQVSFKVRDRCDSEGSDDAPGREIPTYRFETSPNLEIVEARLRSDDDAFAGVRVVCVEEGLPTLVAVDRDNPADRFDLIEADPSYGREPACRTEGG